MQYSVMSQVRHYPIFGNYLLTKNHAEIVALKPWSTTMINILLLVVSAETGVIAALLWRFVIA